ncbi:MAG TPA: biotin/lipoyl-binding protein [Rhizomicrobium sp.]|nr:biotin/lipoyl-binding protein [Rhizomicrobium sp.]
MRNRLIFLGSALGVIIALVSAYVFGQQPSALPPEYNPAANPYAHGIYSEGIVESVQSQGENINIYPEVTGPITRVLVAEGQAVRKGQPLVTIDDSIQRPTTEQQKAQVDVTVAQIAAGKATLKSAADTYSKQERSYELDPKSVSKDVLDTDRNAVKIAQTNLVVFERQSVEQAKTYAASAALLAKYTIKAPADGVVLSIQSAPGSYVSTQGAYDSYTQGFDPLIVMGTQPATLEVRTYVDEILIPRLQNAKAMKGEMFIRGTNIHVPLTFTRVQPFVSPKIELSDERQELVDVRVLPIVFQFQRPKNVNVYPGQLVDVYVSAK